MNVARRFVPQAKRESDTQHRRPRIGLGAVDHKPPRLGQAPTDGAGQHMMGVRGSPARLDVPLRLSMRICKLSVFLIAGTAMHVLPVPASDLVALEHFEKKVRPLLVEKCQVCHNSQLQSGGIDLSSADGFLKALDEAALVSQAEPSSSRLLAIVGYEGRVKMPPTGKLSEPELESLRTWVEGGAPWPGATRPRPGSLGPDGHFTPEQKAYWAFQPVLRPDVPNSGDGGPIDRFLSAKLTEEGLQRTASADRHTWLRRATFDLTGLPPTPKEAAEFAADDSPGAYERVVDRLLASPRYGERWGRHWLDVARYADSTGNDEDHRYPYAWRFRDYVIEAFNSDMPYDQFVREQIAGDLLPAEQSGEVNRRGIIATGFLALGPKAVAQQDKKRMLYDVYDEQIEVVSKAMLGLTVACARCHDHKFDPILTKDYYSLAGIFASTRSFRDPSRHVSSLFFKPLVPQADYQRYQAEQRAITNKRIELDNLADMEIEAYVEAQADSVAEHMLAARAVYEDGGELPGVAAARNLDQRQLARWVDYLRPADVPRVQLAEWRDAMPDGRAKVAQEFQEQFQKTLRAWHRSIRNWRRSTAELLRTGTMPPRPKPRFEAGRDRFFFDVYQAKGGPMRFDGEDREAILKPQTRARIAALRKEVATLKAEAMPEPPMANAVEEGQPVDQRVFVRGDYNSEGDPALKVFPAILAGFDQQPVVSGSGRRELADWIASPDNPLTARVMVNRIWQKHFGQGIVRTPSNFGELGEKPTHPELLDWLASEFVREGWSVKAMHRKILLSDAYRAGGTPSEAAASADPDNRLLSHFSRRRLDVEEMRDGMLAIDGSLDLKVGGTLQSGFGTDGENSNNRLSIDPADSARRLVYLPLRRANLPTLLNLFDFGDAVTSLGKRPVTNVAPQALFMMNSGFVEDRARNLADQLLAVERWEDSDRARHAHLAVLTREATPPEVDAAVSYIGGYAKQFPDATSRDAWQSYCRVLLASNEFLYVD